jgi:O-antigen ligase
MLVYTSVAVFLFSTLALILTSGFSIGASLLVLGSLALLWKRPALALQRDDRVLIAVFLLYFGANAVANLAHSAMLREYDAPARFVLAIPVLLLLLAYPPRPAALWAGLPLGAIGAAVFAGWQSLALGEPRAFGTTNPIQFGNISILFAVLCLAGLAWAAAQRHKAAWTALLLLGAACGTAASILTGSRGSWIALPVSACVLAFQHAGNFGMRRLGAGLLALLALMVAVYALPQTGVKARTELAEVEIRNYLSKGDADSSVGARLEMWRSGMTMVPQRPLLGWGKQGYIDHKAGLIKEGKVSPWLLLFPHLHNEYLDALVKRGVLGLLALLALFLVPLRLFARQLRHAGAAQRTYAAAGVALCVSYLLFGLTQAFMTHNNGVMTYSFLTVMLWAGLRRSQRAA